MYGAQPVEPLIRPDIITLQPQMLTVRIIRPLRSRIVAEVLQVLNLQLTVLRQPPLLRWGLLILHYVGAEIMIIVITADIAQGGVASGNPVDGVVMGFYRIPVNREIPVPLALLPHHAEVIPRLLIVGRDYRHRIQGTNHAVVLLIVIRVSAVAVVLDLRARVDH